MTSAPFLGGAVCVGVGLALVAATPAWAALALCVLALGAAWWARAVRVRAASLLLLALAAAHFAAAAAVRAYAAVEASVPRGVCVFDGDVVDVALSAAGRDTARLRVAAVECAPSAAARVPADDGLWAEIAVKLPLRGAGDSLAVTPGAHVRVRGVARLFAPALSLGAFDPALFARARGLHAQLSVSAVTDIAVLPDTRAWHPFARARLALHARMLALATPREAGLILALLVGDTSLIDDDALATYRKVGAGHLLAVSGLQVTLVAVLAERGLLTLALLTPGGRRGGLRRLPAIGAIVATWCFVFLCGSPPSAVRAAVMACVVLGARVAHRRIGLADALGYAAALTLLLEPLTLTDPSFLLSYAAVVGLVASAGPRGSATRASRAAVMLKGLAAGAGTAVGAGLITVPFSAALFGEVAPAGLVANIVLVPVASLLQLPAMGGGLIGALVGSSALVHLGGEAALLLEALAAGLGDLLPNIVPVAAPRPLPTAALFVLTVIAVAAVARRRLLGAAVSVVALAFSVVAIRAEPRGMRVTFLPVGQGDAAVIELPDGAVMVVDGGGSYDPGDDPGARVVVPFLQRRGIAQVDTLVLSHVHPDHARGLVSIARAFPPRELWTNGTAASAPLLAALVNAVPPTTLVKAPPELRGAGLGELQPWHGAQLAVLAPAPNDGAAQYAELGQNDNSVVLRLCIADDCLLLPGDLEELGEELLLHSGVDVHAAVVKAPHHGSATSSTAPFVAATRAQIVVFCTGTGNLFGFPEAAVIARWAAAGARVFDTGRNGETTIWLTGRGVEVETTLHTPVRPGVRRMQ